MSIKFFCKCGKHLRAREALAGKRSVCPACGELVGVPMLQPTHRGTPVAPLTPAEKSTLRQHAVDPIPAPDSLAAAAQEIFEYGSPDTHHPGALPKQHRHRRRMLALEKHWYECLKFPQYAAHMILLLAVALTALSGVAVTAWPNLGETGIPPWGIWLIAWVAPFLTFGYVCGFLQCVLGSAAAGEIGFVRWPGLDLRFIVRALAMWIVCFLAGPIVFAAAAFWFWFHVGDGTPLDWFIVVELGLVGAAHWLLALVAVHQGDRLRDANPVRVGELIRRLGYGAVLATLGAAAVCLGFGLLILHALTMLHEEPIVPGLLLLVCWFGGLAWLTFFFRLLGLWCFRSRVEAWDAPPAPSLLAAGHPKS